MKNTLRGIFGVARVKANVTSREKIIDMARAVVLILSCTCLGLLIRVLLMHALHLPGSVPQRYNIAKYGPLYFSIAYAVIYEELAFRLHLRPRFMHVCLSGSMLLLLFLKIVIRPLVDIGLGSFLLDLGRDLLLILVFFLLLQRLLPARRLLTRYQSNFQSIYLLTAAVFSLAHLANFAITSVSQLPALATTLLQMFLFGLAFAYIRIKNGMVYAIALHAVTVWVLLR